MIRALVLEHGVGDALLKDLPGPRDCWTRSAAMPHPTAAGWLVCRQEGEAVTSH